MAVGTKKTDAVAPRDSSSAWRLAGWYGLRCLAWNLPKVVDESDLWGSRRLPVNALLFAHAIRASRSEVACSTSFAEMKVRLEPMRFWSAPVPSATSAALSRLFEVYSSAVAVHTLPDSRECG